MLIFVYLDFSDYKHSGLHKASKKRLLWAIDTLVNVYVDLLVFTRIAGTS